MLALLKAVFKDLDTEICSNKENLQNKGSLFHLTHAHGLFSDNNLRTPLGSPV